MRNPIATIALLAALAASAACAFHEPRPAFQARAFISDRGISVPLPPPSLLAEPEQEVEVDGELMGSDMIVDGSIVHLAEQVNGAETTVELEEEAKAFATETLLFMDLTDNCLELWIEAPDGRQGEATLFHAEIVVDEAGQEAIETVEGC